MSETNRQSCLTKKREVAELPSTKAHFTGFLVDQDLESKLPVLIAAMQGSQFAVVQELRPRGEIDSQQREG